MITVSKEAIEALKDGSTAITPLCFLDTEDGPIEITEDIIDIQIKEETTDMLSKVPFGKLTSNVCSITLHNDLDKYTVTNKQSPYYKYLVAGIKLRLSWKLELTNGNSETILGGTFYTADWPSDSSSLECTLECYDLLYMIANNKMPGIKPIKNCSIKRAFEAVFDAAGIAPSKYTFVGIPDTLLNYFYTEEGTVGSTLSNLASTACCNVYTTKKDVIVVSSLLTDSAPDITIDDAIIESTENPVALNSIYDSVQLQYDRIVNVQTEQIIDTKVSIPSGAFSLRDIAFNKCPIVGITSIIIIGAENIMLTKRDYTDRFLVLEGYNSGKPKEIQVKAVGKYLNTTTEFYQIDLVEGSRKNQLAISLPYIIPEALVKQLATQLINIYSNYSSAVTVRTLGLPIIELGDCISLDSEYSIISNKYIIQSSTLDYNGGIHSTFNTLLYKEEIFKKKCCISPGLFI